MGIVELWGAEFEQKRANLHTISDRALAAGAGQARCGNDERRKKRLDVRLFPQRAGCEDSATRTFGDTACLGRAAPSHWTSQRVGLGGCHGAWCSHTSNPLSRQRDDGEEVSRLRSMSKDRAQRRRSRFRVPCLRFGSPHRKARSPPCWTFPSTSAQRGGIPYWPAVRPGPTS